MFTGLNTLDFEKTFKKVHDTRNVVTMFLLVIMYYFYQSLNDDISSAALYVYIIFMIFQIQPKIVRSQNTRYIYLISPSLIHNVFTKFIATSVFVLRVRHIVEVDIPNPANFPLTFKNLTMLALEIGIILLMFSISSSKFALKVKYATNKYAWVFQSGRIALIILLLLFYFLIIPIFLYKNHISLIYYISLAIIAHMSILKAYVKNWKRIRFYFFFFFEVAFIAIAFAIQSGLVDETRAHYVEAMLILLVYKLFIIFQEVNRVYKRFPQPNMHIRIVNKMEKFLKQRMEKWNEQFSIDVIKQGETFTSVQKMLMNKQISVESPGTVSSFISDVLLANLKNAFKNKRLLIFILEVFLNLMIIFRVEIEYNLFGLIYIMYLTTSLCFKRTTLRLKILTFVVYPTFGMLCFQIFLRRSEIKLIKDFVVPGEHLLFINEVSVNNYLTCYGLLAVVYILINLYLLREQKDEEPLVLDQLLLVRNQKQHVKDLALEVAKYTFHLINLLCIFFFLQKIFVELNILNMLVLIIFLLLIFFDSQNIEGLFQLILIYHSIKFTSTLAK